MAKKLLDEERAWDRFIELHVENEESPEHLRAVDDYLEEHPDDEDLEGFEAWVGWKFDDWFNRQEEDAAQEQAESRID